METIELNGDIEIPEDTLNQWQNIVNIMAKLINVPAGLIMRLVGDDIEVFLSSNSENNPYRPGDKEHFQDSGLYCEHVINTQDKLLVANALEDEHWKNNPDVKLNMVSYLGFPILFPDKKPFGTICILDNKGNSYSKTYEDLVLNFREVIQGQLDLIYSNILLGVENKNLLDHIKEIKILRGILPICSFCKKIRNDKGYWETVDSYITEHTEAGFSHGFCPECGEKHYGPFYKKI